MDAVKELRQKAVDLYTSYKVQDETGVSADDLLDSATGWRESMYPLYSNIYYDYENDYDPLVYFTEYFIRTNQYDKFVELQKAHYAGRDDPNWVDLVQRTSNTANDIRFFLYSLGGYLYFMTHNRKDSSVAINPRIFNIPGGEVVYDTIKQYVDGNKIVDFDTVLRKTYDMDVEDYDTVWERESDIHEEKFRACCQSFGIKI